MTFDEQLTWFSLSDPNLSDKDVVLRVELRMDARHRSAKDATRCYKRYCWIDCILSVHAHTLPLYAYAPEGTYSCVSSNLTKEPRCRTLQLDTIAPLTESSQLTRNEIRDVRVSKQKKPSCHRTARNRRSIPITNHGEASLVHIETGAGGSKR